MAQQEFKISFRIIDANGLPSSAQFFGNVTDTDPIEYWMYWLLTFAQKVQALLAGSLVYAEISFPLLSVGTYVTQPAQVGSDIENVGIFRVNGDSYPHKPISIDLPSIDKTLFPDGKLDTAHSDVTAFIASLVSGEGDFRFHDPYGAVYVSGNGGYLTLHRKRGREL